MADNIFASHLTSDLAAECCTGSAVTEYRTDFASVSSLDITSDSDARRFGKPAGRYVTIAFEKLWNLSDDGIMSVAQTAADELAALADRAAPSHRCVLVAGLGNRSLTSDALGPLCVDEVNATRHIKHHEPQLFDELDVCETAALTPGVVGQTGIETLELIRGAVGTVKPDLLVVIDSLAARSVDRLASTIQLTDSGIAPGSGIGNHRRAITRESTGVPTIAIGAPTVVSSATLVCDALEKAGITELPSALDGVLRTGRSFFVSPKECDIAVTELAKVISHAVNTVFSGVF